MNILRWIRLVRCVLSDRITHNTLFDVTRLSCVCLNARRRDRRRRCGRHRHHHSHDPSSSLGDVCTNVKWFAVPCHAVERSTIQILTE